VENVKNAGMRTGNIEPKNGRPNESNEVHKREENVLLMPEKGGKARARKGIECRIRGAGYYPKNASTIRGKTGGSTKSNIAKNAASERSIRGKAIGKDHTSMIEWMPMVSGEKKKEGTMGELRMEKLHERPNGKKVKNDRNDTKENPMKCVFGVLCMRIAAKHVCVMEGYRKNGQISTKGGRAMPIFGGINGNHNIVMGQYWESKCGVFSGSVRTRRRRDKNRKRC
jgi:hypothetical protein